MPRDCGGAPVPAYHCPHLCNLTNQFRRFPDVGLPSPPSGGPPPRPRVQPRFRLSHAPPTPRPAPALGLASCSRRTEDEGAAPGPPDTKSGRRIRVRFRVLAQHPCPASLRPERGRNRETPAVQVSRAGAELLGLMCRQRSGRRRAPPVGLRSSEASIFGVAPQEVGR